MSRLLVSTAFLLPALWLSGCNLFGSDVRCGSDENCAPGDRCDDGACMPPLPVPSDSGSVVVKDAGPDVKGPEDAGPEEPDAGPEPVLCAPRVVVTAGSAEVPAGHPVRLSLDHAALVALGYAADGSDLQLFVEEGGVETARARVLDPRSTWGQASTELWFSLTAPLAANESSSAYVIRSQPDALVLDDERQVFPVADFFERPDADTMEEPWIVPYGGVGIRAGGLEVLAPNNASNRPFVDLPFPAMTTPFELVLGYHFVRTGTENTYRVHLHLGDSVAMVEPPELQTHFARDGAGVSLVWAGVGETLPAEETLAADVVGGYTPLGVVTGEQRLVVRVSPAAARYDVIADGVEIGSTLPLLAATAAFDRFRLVLWEVGTNGIPVRRLEYAFLRPLLVEEPAVVVQLGPDCQ